MPTTKLRTFMIILNMCLFCKGGIRWRTRDRKTLSRCISHFRHLSLLLRQIQEYFITLTRFSCYCFSDTASIIQADDKKRNKPWPCRSLSLRISSYCYSPSQTLHYVPLQITGTRKSSASHLPKHAFDSTHRRNRF